MKKMDQCVCNTTWNQTSTCKSICDGRLLTKVTLGFLHTVYVGILLVGLSGNLLTCMVIKFRKSMRRSIHLYAFNLAICDLLILLFYVPTQMVYVENQLNWTLGIAICKVNNVILPVCLTSTSTTLLAITVDRARGLLQPFKWRSDSQRYAKVSIPVIWVFSFIVNIPLLVYPTVILESFDVLTLKICYEIWPDPAIGLYYWIGNFIVNFAVPLLIIFVIHLIMVYTIGKDKNFHHRSHNRKMIKLTVGVVLTFSICTGSQHVYFFATTLKPNIFSDLQQMSLVYCISNLVVSVQAAVNPIMYGTLRQDFNKAFKGILLKCMKYLKISKKSCLEQDGEAFKTTANLKNGKLLHDDFEYQFIDNHSKEQLVNTLLSNIKDPEFYDFSCEQLRGVKKISSDDERSSEYDNKVGDGNHASDDSIYENLIGNVEETPSYLLTLDQDSEFRLSVFLRNSRETDL